MISNADQQDCPVFHASELALLFGPVPTPIEDDFANQMVDFYVNFITDLTPGGEFHSWINVMEIVWLNFNHLVS